MSDLPFLSATQIETYAGEYLENGCARKWAFKYADRVQVLGNPKAEAAKALGTEVQDYQLDPWLATARPIDFSRPSGEIAQKLVPLLPPPMSPGMTLRKKFVMPSPSGRFLYQGEFDLWADDSAVVPGLSDELRSFGYAPAPLLWDTKTTGNLAYAKDASKLRKDIQCTIYAANMMFSERSLDELDAIWGYTRTKERPKALRYHVRLQAGGVLEQFQKIEAIGIELVTLKSAQTKAKDLPPNPRVCDSFGGCPYRHLCNLSPSVQSAAVIEESKNNMSNANSSFFDKLRKATGAPPAAAAPPPAPAQAPAAALPPWMTAAVDPMKPGVPYKAPAAAVISAPTTPYVLQQFVPPPVIGEVVAGTTNPNAPQFTSHAEAAAYYQGKGYALSAPLAQAAAQAINPPETALPPAPPVGVAAPAAPPPAAAPAPAQAINPPETALPPAPPVGVAAPAAPPPAAAPAPARRGRPAKAAQEATPAVTAPASEGITLAQVEGLVGFMREQGIKRLDFDGDAVVGVEVV